MHLLHDLLLTFTYFFTNHKYLFKLDLENKNSHLMSDLSASHLQLVKWNQTI